MHALTRWPPRGGGWHSLRPKMSVWGHAGAKEPDLTPGVYRTLSFTGTVSIYVCALP